MYNGGNMMESVMENLNNLKVEVKDKVCVITINRPKALNALNSDTLRELSQVIDVVSENEAILGVIITGEGKLDKQTCMGKTPCGVLQAGMRQGIPVIVMGGSVEEVEALNKSGFLAVLPLLPYPVSLEQAMDKDFTCRNIGRALEQQLRVIHYYMNH